MWFYFSIIFWIIINGFYSKNATLFCAAGLFAIAMELAAHYKKRWETP